MHVIIVGAGIGGLVTALRLHRQGIECTVYEQSEPIRELGVGINLLPYAVKELAELELLDRLDDTGIRTHELCYAHRLGPQIMRRRCGLSAGFVVPQMFPMCDRDPLPYWTRGRVTLLGDAAHPMYPMGSSGAGQAILDATALAEHLVRHDDPQDALQRYELERLVATSEIVVSNRAGGPERVIDEVERRAPAGFSRLEDVIAPAALEAIVSSYNRATTAIPSSGPS